LKNYLTVISERYDRQKLDSLKPDYGSPVQTRLDTLFRNVLKSLDMDFQNIQILDVGCGKGRWTRLISEVTHRPQNITGLDASGSAISICVSLSPHIDYYSCDIIKDKIRGKFDVILTMDLFMHFRTREEISLALKNIHQALASNGKFIFYDAYAKNHFETSDSQESQGFHPKEIEQLISQTGFVKLSEFHIFKTFFGKFHSSYFYDRLPFSLIRLLEILVPSPPGNFFQIYSKKEIVK